MLLQVSGDDAKDFSEIAERWIGFVESATGIRIGLLVVIVVAGLFTLKIIRAWRGKN